MTKMYPGSIMVINIILICCFLPPVYCKIDLQVESIVLVDSTATGETSGNLGPAFPVDSTETGETSGNLGPAFPGSSTLQHTCNETQRQSKFRSADGSCNNLEHPSWGQAGAAYLRMLHDDYDDDKSIPRQTSESGSLLPSARTVSQKVFGSESHPHPKRTLMTMQWGQFLDHDITATLSVKVDKQKCCEGINKESYSSGEDCFPIYIEEGDSYFKTNCIGFTRSQKYDGKTKQDKRQQFNSITSFIDGSMIYGSSEEEMIKLRAGKGGLLLTTDMPDGESFLPKNEKEGACRKQDDAGIFCFLAGDARVNVVPGLQAMHTLFVRLHNKIATELTIKGGVKDLFRMPSGPNSDELIFQTTRKIVIAVIQRITYEEYIPSAFGEEFIRQFKLDQPYEYKASVNPQIINEFNTAAFRYGHSQVPDSMKLNGKEVPFHELYYNTEPVLNNFSEVIEDLIKARSEVADKYVSKEMSDKLFLSNKGSLDIVALNIQRGRDHGLPSFAEYRKMCKLPLIKKFEDFGDCEAALRKVYKSPNDVDLYVGGFCDRNLATSVKGVCPTFDCIIGTQFYTLMNGDRFFYKTTNEKLGFTKRQHRFIKKLTLATLLCEFGGMDKVQSNVFFQSSKDNRERACDTFTAPWTRNV